MAVRSGKYGERRNIRVRFLYGYFSSSASSWAMPFTVRSIIFCMEETCEHVSGNRVITSYEGIVSHAGIQFRSQPSESQDNSATRYHTDCSNHSAMTRPSKRTGTSRVVSHNRLNNGRNCFTCWNPVSIADLRIAMCVGPYLWRFQQPVSFHNRVMAFIANIYAHLQISNLHAKSKLFTLVQFKGRATIYIAKNYGTHNYMRECE